MKAAIIESYLKGKKDLPRTAEGIASLIGRLTGEMGFSPLPDTEIKRLTAVFCPAANKAQRANKKTETEQSSGENI